MQTAEYDYKAFQASAQSEQDANLLVKFFHQSVVDKQATELEGRPIYKEVEYVKINVPGSREGVSHPARKRDKDRFPRHYEAFQKRVEMPVEGTPLTEWPLISRSQAEELTFFNVKTVEQMATIADSNLTTFRGGTTLKRKAQEWLAQSKRHATVAEMETQLAARDKALDDMEARYEQALESLQGRILQLEQNEED